MVGLQNFVFIVGAFLVCLSSYYVPKFFVLKKLRKEKEKLENDIGWLKVDEIAAKEKNKRLCEEFDDIKKQIEIEINSKTDKLAEAFEKQKTELDYELLNFLKGQDILKKAKQQDLDVFSKEIDEKVVVMKQELTAYEEQIKTIQSTINAAVAAQNRELEKQMQINFYKINISELDLVDIQKLNRVKLEIRQPVALSKAIWTTYFQKQTTELCNRILGNKKVCGIYKITNLKTEQCYIGQSVDISQRWKDHVKCGLGIEASATNKLYKAMQEEGVWNFSFEVLEECPRDQLNTKERQWIEIYQSNIYSYNSTKGNS